LKFFSSFFNNWLARLQSQTAWLFNGGGDFIFNDCHQINFL